MLDLNADQRANAERSAANHNNLGRASVYTLGRFEVRVDGRLLLDRTWKRSKAKALIKLLALQPTRSLHREQVCEILWPDLDAEAAANNLYKNLHYIRSALGGETQLISLVDGVVVLDCGVLVDAETFRAHSLEAIKSRDIDLCEGALAIWPTGALLPDNVYEEWTSRQRNELADLRQRLLLHAAALHESGGDLRAAEARLHDALANDPLDESAHRALIRVFAAAGATERALRQYDVCREILERELGASPSAETETLVTRILSDGRSSSDGPADADTRSAADWRQLAVRAAATDAARAAGYYEKAITTLRAQPAPDATLEIDLLIELAANAAKSGEVARAFSTYREAFKMADAGHADAERVARAALGMYATRQPFTDSHLKKALQRAHQLLPQTDSVLGARVMAARARWQWPGEAEQTRRESADILRKFGHAPGPPEAFDVNAAMDLWMVEPSSINARLREIDDVIAAAVEMGDPYAEMWAWYGRYRLGCQTGFDALEPAGSFGPFSKLAARLDVPYARWLDLASRAATQLRSGKWQEAEEQSDSAFRYGSQHVKSIVVAYHRGAQSLILSRERGTAGSILERIESNFARFGGHENRATLAVLYADAGRLDEARPLFLHARQTLFGPGPADMAMFLVDPCVALDDRDAAEYLYNVLLPYERLYVAMLGGAVMLGATARGLGSLAAMLERWDDAERHFIDAIRMNREYRARPWVAHAQVEYARMLLTRGLDDDGARAVQLLDDASTTARDVGMPVLSAKIAKLRALSS